MTPKDKHTILSLRGKGLTCAQIADRLELSVNTVKSVCRREKEKKKRCRNCHRLLSPNNGGRPKSFCCDECRILWWKKHPEQVNRKAFYLLTCKNCGQDFESYGHKERKYCCHRCYINCRFPDPKIKDDKT